MASISSLGIGSGLDLNGLLDKLTKAEQQRLTPYTTQQTSYNAQLTAYGTLKGSLEKFDNLSKELAKPTFFNNTTASKHDQFAITTTDKAVAGNYIVEVQKLAQPQTLTTQASITNQTEKLGTPGSIDRSITITAGDPQKEVKIPLSDDQTSLVEMRDAINNAKAGVNASIMRVGDNDYQLAISSTATGEKNTVSVQVNNDDKLGAILNYDSAAKSNAMKQTVAGQDAEVLVNGTKIKRSTNSIADALQGVTIDLKTVTKKDEPQNLVISTDKTGTADKIKDWVDNYNSLLDTFNSLTKYTPVKTGEAQNAKNGALLGDNTLRGVQSSIKSALSGAQDNPELKGLGNLGITTNTKTGKLEIDSTKLNKAIDEKPEQVANFFAGNGKDTGMATEIHNEIQSYIKAGGIIENSTKSINTSLDRLNSKITTVTASIQSTIDRYKQQFVQLDTMMSKLSGTGDYLKQQFK
ncbi:MULTISPECIES: flagellar filament capping protein FliD [Serratia]|jgi:flagellar hook-associated protein 2|uniref:Flagellar hook-associated protein 2 n=1 Tax=Serratia liquefaciens TaxID=614 RepID=A0ABX7DB97_SERLI|nr:MULTISPECIES: flagellar filament capping protein FliD [Serratia]AYO38697.1 flagellar filament capping protein FliD [Serratia sp. P2ACOL2]MCS4317443.1 flagellar hook-associated protein 2 [Serratia sp. BIGb0234]MDU5486034.1 flagellar filament capping protein FliD [Serratia liquefaciens]OKP23282.1 flagellar filament capping protein FliD [Serratia liquefaciens]QQU57112.1 flagellar filament capping protein FliD [Serratia liquefaciens]